MKTFLMAPLLAAAMLSTGCMASKETTALRAADAHIVAMDACSDAVPEAIKEGKFDTVLEDPICAAADQSGAAMKAAYEEVGEPTDKMKAKNKAVEAAAFRLGAALLEGMLQSISEMFKK